MIQKRLECSASERGIIRHLNKMAHVMGNISVLYNACNIQFMDFSVG